MAIRFPGCSRPASIEGSSQYWFDQNAALPKRKADRVAEAIAAGEQAIEDVPAFRRSWALAEERRLRESLPQLAAALTAEEVYQHVHDELTAAASRNFKNRKASHV